MKNRKTILAAIAGFLIGFFVKSQIKATQTVSPELALERAKKLFTESGPITGSWIYVTPMSMTKNGLPYTVYRGGVTRQVDDNTIEYEFYSDVNSGTVIDVDYFTA